MPLSISAEDIWGNDVENNPMIFSEGDSDGIAEPTGRGIFRTDWLANSTAIVPLWLFTENGAPSPIDPRHVLAGVLERYQQANLTPVTAVELEFYLVDPNQPQPTAPTPPDAVKPLQGDAILSMDLVDQFEGFFADLYAACETHGLNPDAAISEGGVGQFEVNLLHNSDAMKSADDAVLFKRFTKGIAQKHGLAASFMAKPYVDGAGSGLHLHFSILDKDGNNVFDNQTDEGSPTLLHAIDGVMNSLPDMGLIFAPHRNSYRRLTPESHAPTGICWGYENRTAAIRVPGGPSAARRIEHRVAGADANPYLVLAAILGAALDGIENGQMPVDPINGDAYGADIPQISDNWRMAIDKFEFGASAKRIFPDQMHSVYSLLKRQELRRFESRMSAFEVSTYLNVV